MPYLSPHELSLTPAQRNRPTPPIDWPLIQANVRQAPLRSTDEAHGRAFTDWLAHVEAGRIGVAAPAPAAAIVDRLAALKAILGLRPTPRSARRVQA